MVVFLETQGLLSSGGRWVVSDHRPGPAQGGEQNLLMEVLPTAHCPEGENHNQEAAGVSWTCWQGSGLEPGELVGWGVPEPLPQPWWMSIPKHFIFLRNVPSSQMGKLRPRYARYPSDRK